jgi:hypothetical protein
MYEMPINNVCLQNGEAVQTLLKYKYRHTDDTDCIDFPGTYFFYLKIPSLMKVLDNLNRLNNSFTD